MKAIANAMLEFLRERFLLLDEFLHFGDSLPQDLRSRSGRNRFRECTLAKPVRKLISCSSNASFTLTIDFENSEWCPFICRDKDICCREDAVVCVERRQSSMYLTQLYSDRVAVRQFRRQALEASYDPLPKWRILQHRLANRGLQQQGGPAPMSDTCISYVNGTSRHSAHTCAASFEYRL